VCRVLFWVFRTGRRKLDVIDLHYSFIQAQSVKKLSMAEIVCLGVVFLHLNSSSAPCENWSALSGLYLIKDVPRVNTVGKRNLVIELSMDGDNGVWSVD